MCPFWSDQLSNMVKMHSSKQSESYGLTKYAILKEFDPTNCICKVAWYNANTDDYDSLISGWLPIVVPFIGQGDDTQSGGGISWGYCGPPNIGQPVVVISQHGDFNNGLVVGGTYSAKSPPPQVDGQYTQDGEWLVMHKSGSYLKFFNNGDVTLYTSGDFNLHVGKNMNAHIEGDLTVQVDGTISIKTNKAATVKAASTITLDVPLVQATQALTIGKAATGSFVTEDYKIVTVGAGITTNIS